jgi:hypothetical protein
MSKKNKFVDGFAFIPINENLIRINIIKDDKIIHSELTGRIFFKEKISIKELKEIFGEENE